MARLEDGISGVTSNPTFEKAMGHSDRYDDAFRGDDTQEIFERLAYLDIAEAAQAPPAHIREDARPGRIRLLRGAGIGCSTPEQRSMRPQGRDRPADVLIGHRRWSVFEELTALGVDVNVTLLFRGGAEAISRGVRQGTRAASASRRVDRQVGLSGELLRLAHGHEAPTGDRPRSRGQGGGGQMPRMAYICSGSSAALGGEALEGRACSARCGPRPRPRTPDSDTPVDEIGPDTVNTMPNATMETSSPPRPDPHQDVDQAG